MLSIFLDIILENNAQELGIYLSYIAYSLSCGELLDPFRMKGYGEHKLIRDRKPSLVALLNRIEEEQAALKMTPILLRIKKSLIKVKGRVSLGRPWEEP